MAAARWTQPWLGLTMLIASAGCVRHWTAQVDDEQLARLRPQREDHGTALCRGSGEPLPVRQLHVTKVEGDPDSASFAPPLPLREALAHEDTPAGQYHLEELSEPNAGDYTIMALAIAGTGALTVSGGIALIYLIPCLGPTNCQGVPSWDGWLAVGGLGTMALSFTLLGITEAVFGSGGGDAGPVTACHEPAE